MAHYVGVLMPLETGGWRAVFPDVPECRVEAASLDLTVFHAAAALADLNQRSDRQLAAPRDLAEIRLDDVWASACGVDWSRSVVTMIPVHGQVRTNGIVATDIIQKSPSRRLSLGSSAPAAKPSPPRLRRICS